MCIAQISQNEFNFPTTTTKDIENTVITTIDEEHIFQSTFLNCYK